MCLTFSYYLSDILFFFYLQLLTEMEEWLPEEVASSRGGRELPTVSALGPFLSISVFPEEDPAVAEAHFNPPVNKATIRCGYSKSFNCILLW